MPCFGCLTINAIVCVLISLTIVINLYMVVLYILFVKWPFMPETFNRAAAKFLVINIDDDMIMMQLRNYMLLLLFITIARIYKAYLGLSYIYQHKYKPRWNESLFCDKKGNAHEIEAMEYDFSNWNRTMRIKLEQYYRGAVVITSAYIIQNIMILAFFFEYLQWWPIIMTAATSVLLVLDSLCCYRLLQIKVRDTRREWKRKETYVYSQNSHLQT